MAEKKSVADFDRQMAVGQKEGDLVWYDPDKAPFQINGFAFRSRGEVFRRVPLDEKYPDAINYLGGHTAGGMVRFCSNTSRMAVRVKLSGANHMDHIPWTGVCGFDLYCGLPGKKQYFLGVTRGKLTDDEYESNVGRTMTPVMREYTLNMPLYSGVESLEIGLDENAEILPPSPWADESPLVIYGTSITQGGCASRPGMCYTSILSRRLNREVFNFGFSGSGKGETVVAEMLAQVKNPALYVLDYEANAHFDGIKQTVDDVVAEIRKKHPAVPIVLVSQLRFNEEFRYIDDPADQVAQLEESRKFQSDFVDRKRAEGDDFIYYVDGSKFTGSDWHECSVDGCHQSDLGFYLMANALEPVLREILNK